jgi:predicted ATPase
MSNKIAVENYKIFKNKTEFIFDGITILTGPNGCGKSSIIEVFDLMISNFKEGPPYYLNLNTLTHKERKDISIRIENIERKNEVVTFKYPTINYCNVEVEYLYDKFLDVYKIQNVKILYGGLIKPLNDPINLVEEHIWGDSLLLKINYGKYKKIIDGNHTYFEGLLDNFPIIKENNKNIKDLLNEQKSPFNESYEIPEIVFWEIKENIDTPTIVDSRFLNVEGLLFLGIQANNKIRTTYKPFLNKSKLFDEVEFDFLNLSRISKLSGIKIQNWMNKMLCDFGFGKEIKIVCLFKNIFRIYITRNNQSELDICELSNGEYNIVLLIVFLASNLTDDIYIWDWLPRQIYIQEPETYLHPDFQAKLALLVKGFIEFKINNSEGGFFYEESENAIDQVVVVETHSEYFIRQLQYLTAKKQFNASNLINIFYFNKISENEVSPYLIEINNDGSLSKAFGTGFFDLADNIAIDIFRLQHNSSN